MKILFTAPENTPYAQVGGLSQVVSLLARAERKLGIDTRIFMPKYGVINTKKYPMEPNTMQISIPTGHPKGSKFPASLVCNVLFRDADKKNAPAYFLENREYFELRANVYGYSDEHIRFYLLSYGALEWLLLQKQNNGWLPDILHAHDWHTGYLVDAIKNNPRYKKALGDIKVLYTIHNLKYQGNFDFRFAEKQSSEKEPLLPAFHPNMRMQNSMLRGIIYADLVNTVSHTYAEEIRTKEFGEGLSRNLQKVSHKLSGIPNGIDTTEMNPTTDKNITANYSTKSLHKRKANKLALQKLFKFPANPGVPLVAFIGRLVAQKGIENIFETLEHMDSLPAAQFIFVGGGDDNFRTVMQKLCARHPDNVAATFQLDFVLPRKIFAGSDIILIPSRFEPGGIVAMEALRYGCVPLVSDTGGLSETVKQFDPVTGQGNGFFHKRNDVWSFAAALIATIQIYKIPQVWKKVIINGMSCDFSWQHTALEYEKLYKKLM